MHTFHPVNKGRPPTRAVVLAAGRGRRLRPYTDSRPKPLLELDGRPLLAYTLDALAAAGVERVCLVVGYRGEQIEAFTGGGRRWGLEISLRRQSEPRGTADAVRLARDFISAPAFVLAADYALPPDYLQALKAAYIRCGAPLAVSLKRLPAQELAASSSVLFDDDGRIRRIVEKPAPAAAPSNVAASLIYIAPPDIRAYLQRLTLSPRGEYELVDVINRMIDDGYEICGLRQSPPPGWRPPGGEGAGE